MADRESTHGLFVVGMHRSGTSLVASILESLGFYIGSIDDQIPPAPDNPRGFWERRDVKELNEEILRSNSSTWSEIGKLPFEVSEAQEEQMRSIVNQLSSPWLIKDPRLSVTLEHWIKVFPDARIVLVIRHPLSVARSLQVRNGFGLDQGLHLWQRYLGESLRQMEHLHPIVVIYEKLLESPDHEVKRLHQKLNKTISSMLAPPSDIGRVLVPPQTFFELDALDALQNLTALQYLLYEACYNGDLNLARTIANRGVNTQTTSDLKYLGLDIRDLVEENQELKSEVESISDDFIGLNLKSAQLERALLQSTRREFSEKQRNQKREYLIKSYRNALNERQQRIRNLELVSKGHLAKMAQIAEEANALRIKIGELETDLHLVRNDREDIRSSVSFKLGWSLTRPLALFGRFFHGESRIIEKGQLLLSLGRVAMGHPRSVLRVFSWQRVKTLQRALAEESPRTIAQNFKKLLEYKPQPKNDPVDLEALSARINSFVRGNHSKLRSEPLVSIIMLNRNGLHHLKRFQKAFRANTTYSNYELIFVDNNSNDKSLSYFQQIFPAARIIANQVNLSFSQANNKAVKIAKGKYICFLNNDVEPLLGWLSTLVKEAERSGDRFGSIGAQLLYPSDHHQAPLCVQHAGIGFSSHADFLRPVNLEVGEMPILVDQDPKVRIAVTGACLLMKKSVFGEIGGFTESYNYGYEDVDLGIRLTKGGYHNYYCASSILLHNEFGTQLRSTSDELRKRRLDNIAILQSSWANLIRERFVGEVLGEDDLLFFGSKLSVVIIVTDTDRGTRAGDYFTGLELAQALEKLGWTVNLKANRGEDRLSISSNYHVVISLLDNYEIEKVRCDNRSLLKICWARNWFDRWAIREGFSSFDVVLTSSSKSVEYFRKYTSAPIYFFPIATNPDRFKLGSFQKEYESDYVFTGSYWDDPRDIQKQLDPANLREWSGAIYGSNWEKDEKLSLIHRGDVSYFEMPNVYASTKLVLDDANRVTKPWGSVNSRVFDALGSGRLVLTNGAMGAEELFGDLLPVFDSKAQLEDLVDRYLSDSRERRSLAEAAQSIVLKNHTYDHRASYLRTVLKEYFGARSLVIKVPAPNREVAREWGDFHLAHGFKRALVQKGWRVKIQTLDEWNDTTDVDYSHTFVLRGLSRYQPKKHAINFLWLISHPDKVSLDELQQYDAVFVASESYAKILKAQLSVPVFTLLQCTDPERFRPSHQPIKHANLFVGNSRKVHRKIIRDMQSIGEEVVVFGTNWEKFIPPSWLRGLHIPNQDLSDYYSGAEVLLNDHWATMSEFGFISNRIFDGLACNANILTDRVDGMEELFGDWITCYDEVEDLKFALEKARSKEVINSREWIVKNHSFAARVEQFLTALQSLELSASPEVTDYEEA